MIKCESETKSAEAGPDQTVASTEMSSEHYGLQVLALKGDRVCGAALGLAVKQTWANAVVRCSGSIAEAREALAQSPVDLLLSGFRLPDGDILSLLALPDSERRWRRAFIVTGRREERVLTLLRSSPIAGIFDSAIEDFAKLAQVLPAAMVGRGYWSPSVLSRLREPATAPNSLGRMLTPMELLVFSAVGDGSDDQAAGVLLGRKASTVQTVRRALHEKLGISHRGQLMRLAAEKGVVQISAGGVHRPGFDTLLMNRCRKTP